MLKEGGSFKGYLFFSATRALFPRSSVFSGNEVPELCASRFLPCNLQHQQEPIHLLVFERWKL